MTEPDLPVLAMKTRRLRGSGNVMITFKVHPETWMRFVREAERSGHPDTFDYLMAALNAALLNPMSGMDGGGPDQELPASGDDDLDDDIPF
jgi:hypothetical protein